jgi:hypothetical protein
MVVCGWSLDLTGKQQEKKHEIYTQRIRFKERVVCAVSGSAVGTNTAGVWAI